MNRTALLAVVAAVVLPGAGCVQTKISEPPRTATEQLMLSTATDRSLRGAPMLEMFKDKKVFVDAQYFESYDKPYVIGALRQMLSDHGALLATSAANSDVVLEPRSGALSTDSSSSLIGMPSLPVPVPFAGNVTTPEIYFMKTQKLYSVAKLALFAYEQKSGGHFYSSGPLVGKARLKYYSFLGFISITRTDVPEKKNQ
ncbi:MAG TPA: DUF6655 family protein [Verrucomicrobiae bacterium]|nr:DUF6655 family protein [Verrucomicrobiae bacterium]